MKRLLLLADGTIFEGEGFGAERPVKGEVVFTTGMTGYQETITDQSYNGQLVVFTYPLIGNYGINRDDMETFVPTCAGVICREVARRPSNWRANMSLPEFLEQKNIPGISGIDTRRLTRIIREKGTEKGVILPADADIPAELAALQQTVLPSDQVKQVSTKNAYPNPNVGRRVVVIDFGLKNSILRELNKRQCSVIVLPYQATAEEILSYQPDGVMLTNGPGDPKSLPEAIQTIRFLMGKVPVFGICLGHQLLALANGADTYKMKFGHRGFNHPVREIATGRIDFTSQNHGYAVSRENFPKENLYVTHVEINDQTVEGIRHRIHPAFSVQYHPDAAPGPHDAVHLFDDFMGLIDSWKEQQHA